MTIVCNNLDKRKLVVMVSCPTTNSVELDLSIDIYIYIAYIYITEIEAITEIEVITVAYLRGRFLVILVQKW